MTGTLAAVSLDLEGIGLCAKNSVDELFNFSVQVTNTKTQTEIVVRQTPQSTLLIDSLSVDINDVSGLAGCEFIYCVALPNEDFLRLTTGA